MSNRKLNRTEQKAYDWLIRQGFKPEDIKRNDTPDFLTPRGGYEVKLLYGNTMVFYGHQIALLQKQPDTTMLLFAPDGFDPVDVRKFSDIDVHNKKWGQYTIATDDRKALRVDDDIYERLDRIRHRGETFDGTINRLLELYEKALSFVRE